MPPKYTPIEIATQQELDDHLFRTELKYNECNTFKNTAVEWINEIHKINIDMFYHARFVDILVRLEELNRTKGSSIQNKLTDMIESDKALLEEFNKPYYNSLSRSEQEQYIELVKNIFIHQIHLCVRIICKNIDNTIIFKQQNYLPLPPIISTINDKLSTMNKLDAELTGLNQRGLTQAGGANMSKALYKCYKKTYLMSKGF